MKRIFALLIVAISWKASASEDMPWGYEVNYDKFDKFFEHMSWVATPDKNALFSLNCRVYDDSPIGPLNNFVSVAYIEPIGEFGSDVTLKILLHDGHVATFDARIYSDTKRSLYLELDSLDILRMFAMRLQEGDGFEVEINPKPTGKTLQFKFTSNGANSAINSMLTNCVKI